MSARTVLCTYVSLFLASGVLATAAYGQTWEELNQQARTALEGRQREKAQLLFRKCIEQARNPTQMAISENDLGVVLHESGRDAEAEPWLRKSQKHWQELGDTATAARSAHSLAAVYRMRGDYPESKRVLREALASHPANKKTQARLWNLLGGVLAEEGQLDASREAIENTLKIPDLPWQVLADARITMADILRQEHQYDASVEMLTRVLRDARKNEERNIEGIVLRGMGETLLEGGDPARAEPALRKALAIFEVQKDDYEIAAALGCLGGLYLVKDKPAMAEDALRRAIDMIEPILGPTHPQLAVLLQLRADASARLRAMPRSTDDMDRAWRIIAGRFGEESAAAGTFLANRAVIEQRAGDASAAVADYERGLKILRGTRPPARSVVAAVMERYASVLRSLHRKSQAQALLAEARSLREEGQ